MVEVSVIMPVYEAEEFLEDTIKNFARQTIEDVELICVNDGSTDNSLEILKQQAKKYDFIKILNQENQGSGSARNNGIENACGEYIAFLDADDRYMNNDALKIMYEYGHKNDANIVCANLERITQNMKKVGNFNYEKNNYTKFSEYECVNSLDYGIPWAFYKNIFKREFIDENNIKFPDLMRGQDPVFMAEALVCTDKIYTTPITLYGYNYMVNGGTNAKVDSYTKKYDYMMHFKMTIEVLESNGFYDLAGRYKDQLVIFLSLNRNRSDDELLKIVHEIFEDGNNTYFEMQNEEMIYLRLCMINKDDEDALFNEFQTIKRALLEVTQMHTYFPDAEILRRYVEVEKLIKSKSADDIMKQQKQLNFEVSNSSSWKVTRPLRKTKSVTIKVLKKIKHTLVKLW